MLEIVRFVSDQYVDLARVLTAAYDGLTFHPESLRDLDENLADHYIAKRWMGLDYGRPVACAEYRHTPEMFHPREFLMTIAVHPGYQGQGLGGRMYDRIREDIAIHNPLKVRAACRADHVRTVGFLERRGFVRGMRILELQLDLGRNPVGRARDRRECNAGPVEISTLSELARDPDRNWKLYNLITALREDIPLPDAATQVTFEHFVATFVEAPSRLPDATFVARFAGEYVGFCDLHADADGGLRCGLTGVLSMYRGSGIANTLKAASSNFARTHAYRHIRTFNDATNGAILAVNRSAGFSVRSSWLHFTRII